MKNVFFVSKMAVRYEIAENVKAYIGKCIEKDEDLIATFPNIKRYELFGIVVDYIITNSFMPKKNVMNLFYKYDDYCIWKPLMILKMFKVTKIDFMKQILPLLFPCVGLMEGELERKFPGSPKIAIYNKYVEGFEKCGGRRPCFMAKFGASPCGPKIVVSVCAFNKN